MTRHHIGGINYINATRGHLAKCSECEWQIAKKARADALDLLRSHYRIAHLHTAQPVYLED